MKIKPQHVELVIIGLVSQALYWPALACFYRLGIAHWASAILSMVIAAVACIPISEPLCDMYMIWHVRRLLAQKRNARQE